MCGISGLYYFERGRLADVDVARAMSRVLAHRGPDDEGVFADRNVALAFTRLSIIDLSGGHQPMSNEDGTVTIVFNGEIYNYLELRHELTQRGWRLRTRSDTETILCAWQEFGERCVDYLRGMFAFVVWDARQGVLFGARDRLGIKPFYYFTGDDQFCFASEMKSLLQVPGLPRDLDPEALAEYLLHRYVIGPKTMLKGVRKLPPGHCVVVSGKAVRVKKYWQPPMDVRSEAAEADVLEELDALLKEVVQIHMLADVPLGAFLSGGLDSSAVVGLMRRYGAENVKTFSIGYDAPESELRHGRAVAEHCGTDHHEYVLSPADFRDLLPRIVWSMDEPVGDEAAVPLFYLSRFASETVKVVLSGEGSDEIFGGYPIYGRMLNFESWNRIPGSKLLGGLSRLLPEGKLRHYGEMLGRPLDRRYRGVSRLFTRSEAARLCPKVDGFSDSEVDRIYARCRSLPALTQLLHVDLSTWLADDLLVKADRMSMANSLELRVPFLDHRLVEFALRLPPSLKFRNGSGKYVLKRYCEGFLPKRIVHRRKAGFPVPTKSWFRGELEGYARETLLERNSPTSDWLSRREIERLLDTQKRRDRGGAIYGLLVLDQWQRMFVNGPPPLVDDCVGSTAKT